MLTKEQIDEIREHLERAQNPLFLYDNDADGLCSFLLLRRWLGRGKGMAIRSYPGLNRSYATRASTMNADYVFVLDKPVIEDEFVQGVHELGIPLVWIDHHEMPERALFENMFLYNPASNKNGEKSTEPVTYWCYKITGRKQDLWLAVVGCISDHYLPDFAKDFAEQYPEFWGAVKEPFDAYFGTEIGKIAQALNFGVKDRAVSVENMQNFLLSCNSPSDVFAETEANKNFREHVASIRRKFENILEGAQKHVQGKILFFEYGGETSMSSEISNALVYRNKGIDYIAVAFKKGSVYNISIRGKGARAILDKILPQIPNSNGGGHENAVGARIPTSEIGKFRELFLGEVNKL